MYPILYHSQLTGKINSRLASAGGKHPDVQYFFGGYSALCGNEVVVDPQQFGDDAEKRTVTYVYSKVFIHFTSYHYYSQVL